MDPTLEGLKLLLVEDDDLVSFTVEEMLLQAKAASVVVVADVPAALQALAQGDFDAAIVDINLGGQHSWPVAEELRRRDIPYLTVTGYGDGLTHELLGKLLTKPYSMQQMLEAVASLVR
jgi:DNA-binding response OmpR family regulator